ncbi:MAG TPA: hypothetical protein PK858_11530, partial [Saprospiraceae bacterium]|nr:hypothetical protein [Saprospiraceae bacterium]
GILQQAKAIHQGLSSGNYQYYADSYCYEVKRLLQTVQKFKDMGVDYEPALRELRAVFPASKAHPYRAVALIDNEMEEMRL